MKPRTIHLHQSLLRPILLAGGERQLALINFVLIAVLVFGIGFNYFTVAFAIVMATFGHSIIIQLAKNDPLMSQVYLRHLSYADYYAASSYYKTNLKIRS